MRKKSGGLVIVRVSYSKTARPEPSGHGGYAFLWPFARTPKVGDVVVTDAGTEAKVIGFGTEWTGPIARLSKLVSPVDEPGAEAAPVAVVRRRSWWRFGRK